MGEHNHDEEALKRQAWEGPNVPRSRRAFQFEEADDRTGRLNALMVQGYFNPSAEELNDPAIAEWLREKRVRVIIPMKEDQRTVAEALRYLSAVLDDPSSIIVVNDGSSSVAVNAVHEFSSVLLIEASEVLETINWKRLLPVLNLTERPRGKGVTVLAGMLFLFALMEGESMDHLWVFQSDADIKAYDRYDPLRYLVHPIVHEPDGFNYIKAAKPGRNNETVMAARANLQVLAGFPGLSKAIHRRARTMFEGLSRHKWMLCGEILMNMQDAMRRPYATGYLEETLMSLFFLDYNNAKSGRRFAQVANQQPRLDVPNTDEKEEIMMQWIAGAIQAFALFAKPSHEWTVADIKRLNHDVMPLHRYIASIPETEEPVIQKPLKNDRIIPPVTTLWEEGFVDHESLRTIAREVAIAS